MAFHDVRLPLRLAFGSTGGLERRTRVTTLASGYEQRSSPWAFGRRRYLIGGGLRSLDDAATLTAFFEARRGRLHGFRFKDFSDFKSCAPSAPPGPMDQRLGRGDGRRTGFALVKAHGDVLRPILKPVPGSISAAVNGLAQAVSVDAESGLLRFAQPPADGASVTAGFMFDVPVRFDSDRLDVTLEGFDTARIVAVPLVELRL